MKSVLLKYDWTKENTKSLVHKEREEINHDKDSILEDVEFQKETKLALLESAIKNTPTDSPEFKDLLENMLDILCGDTLDDGKRVEISNRIKFEIDNLQPHTEDIKPEYIADKWIRRPIQTLREATKVNK